MEQRNIQTKQGAVYYWVSENWDPEQDTLVFLHGMTGDHTMFAPQMDEFRDYNLVAWDAPAHGVSRPYGEFSYPNAARALRDILTAEHVQAAVLIGQSMGGFLAQAFLLGEEFIGDDCCAGRSGSGPLWESTPRPMGRATTPNRMCSGSSRWNGWRTCTPCAP